MAKCDTLQVNYRQHTLGWIHRPHNTDKLSFTYDNEWIRSNFSPISVSLPVRSDPYGNDFSDNYFGNLLPDGDSLSIISKYKRISRNDVFCFLKHYGREVAGALTIFPANENPPPAIYAYKDVTDLVIASIGGLNPKDSNLILDTNARMSIAGAQNKLAILWKDEKIYIPEIDSGAPTSHIVKPVTGDINSIHLNESFCMNLALQAGLNVPKSEIIHIDRFPLYLVERYDRKLDEHNQLTRIHQEDFCQALNFNKRFKYEGDGGPGFKECVNMLKQQARITDHDFDQFIGIVLYNFIIGNCDAHGKNFSILYGHDLSDAPNRKLVLAPFYDLISTTSYPRFSKKLAMFIGADKEHGIISVDSLIRLTDDFQVSQDRFADIFVRLKENVSSRIIQVKESHIELHGNKEFFNGLSKTITINIRILSRQIDSLRAKNNKIPKT
jgi:serine/threonine-protein kinase HipA